MELLFVLVAVVYGIIKNDSQQTALPGMAIFAVAYWLGLHSIPSADKSTGFDLFDLFEVFKGIFSYRAAGLGLTIMAVAGFATYMSHIGASQALVRVAVKPVAGSSPASRRSPSASWWRYQSPCLSPPPPALACS